MGRTQSQLSPEFRRALRRAHRRAKASDEALRELVKQGLVDKEPLAAMAREMGITKQVLWARVESWKRGDQ